MFREIYWYLDYEYGHKIATVTFWNRQADRQAENSNWSFDLKTSCDGGTRITNKLLSWAYGVNRAFFVNKLNWFIENTTWVLWRYQDRKFLHKNCHHGLPKVKKTIFWTIELDQIGLKMYSEMVFGIRIRENCYRGLLVSTIQVWLTRFIWLEHTPWDWIWALESWVDQILFLDSKFKYVDPLIASGILKGCWRKSEDVLTLLEKALQRDCRYLKYEKEFKNLCSSIQESTTVSIFYKNRRVAPHGSSIAILLWNL